MQKSYVNINLFSAEMFLLVLLYPSFVQRLEDNILSLIGQRLPCKDI